MLAVEKALPASILSVSTALVFPVILLAALGSLGLNGLWINFPATSALAAVLAFFHPAPDPGRPAPSRRRLTPKEASL